MLKHSKSVKVIKNLLKKYRSFNGKVRAIYNESSVHNILETVRDGLKRCIKESFLRKITEKNNKKLFYGPIPIRSVLIFNTVKGKAAVSFNHSIIGLFVHSARAGFYANALKTISIMVIAALATNAVILTALNIKIGLFSRIIQAAFILLSMAVIFGASNWKNVKGASVFIKLFAKGEKN